MRRALVKQHAKQLVRRSIGEPYVGKRLKLRRLDGVLPTLGLRPSSVLDAGAEDATFVYWLADLYPEATITAVDIDADAIDACREARPTAYARRVRFEVSTFSALESQAFDLITAFDVLEHIEDDRAAAADLARALRPGGTILVHVPRDRWRTWSGTEQRVPDHEAWRINPGHVRHGYSPDALRRLLTDAGLTVEDVQTWVGRWGVLAHTAYALLENPVPLRLLSIPVTELCARLDRRSPSGDGNTLFVRAVRPTMSGV
jgi:2-polyprenyl-3-methyl-5-hydroxy-6-metoxy-1,4-benzoquinol methylase